MSFTVPHVFHFVCLRCRRSAKGQRFFELTERFRREGWRLRPMKCTHCGGEMPCVGKRFTPPRRTDDKQWKKLEWMLSHGWPAADWQTSPTMSLREVREIAPPRRDPDQKRLRLWEQQRALQKQMKKAQCHKARKARQQKKVAAKEWQRQLEYQSRIMNSKND